MIQMTSLVFCPILGIILIPPMPWLPLMIQYVPSKSFLTINLLDMMAWCPSISSMHHIVCMSWWQLFYRIWWNIASKSNYRSIALSTVASKILEIILVNHVEECIVTTENQFAYKKGHSTDMCIFTLKGCIRYYTVHNTPMYVCFLMLAKILIVSITGNFLRFLLIENALPMLSKC